MAKKTKTPTTVKPEKTVNRTKASKSSDKPRKLKKPAYKSFRLQKRIKPPTKIPNAGRLFIESIKLLIRHWRLFALVAIVYGLVTIVLVGGTGNTIDFHGIRDTINASVQGKNAELLTGITVFGALIGSATTVGQGVASAYQTVLLLMVSLAVIWALRESLAGNKVTTRDAFYKGMRPLVPFLLVLSVMFLQLFPLMLGSYLYNIAVNAGIFNSLLEQVIITLPFFLLAVLSLYMITSSIFALYIVTLPNMTPMEALRAARKIVSFRRFAVMRKVLFLPLMLFILAALIMFPVIFLALGIVPVVFFSLGIVGLIVFHSYMYILYRSLL